MGKRKEILSGQVFGKLTILKELPSENKKRMFLCCCECGTVKKVALANLLNGSTHTCGGKGCKSGIKHGMSRTRIYKIWQDILGRCDNKEKKGGAWYKYGKKGIRVCDEWSNKDNGFLNFYKWAIENGYSDEKDSNGRAKITIDRIDGTKGYSPNNCRWVDYETQNCNLSMLSTNKSGYRGISWSKKEKKWICVISIKNHSIRIGAYKTQKEAVEARNKYIEEQNLPHQKNVYKGELSNGY